MDNRYADNMVCTADDCGEWCYFFKERRGGRCELRAKDPDSPIEDVPCKWKWGEPSGLCKRHAPLAVSNPGHEPLKDSRRVLTEFPDARCPCGDYEPKE